MLQLAAIATCTSPLPVFSIASRLWHSLAACALSSLQAQVFHLQETSQLLWPTGERTRVGFCAWFSRNNRQRCQVSRLTICKPISYCTCPVLLTCATTHAMKKQTAETVLLWYTYYSTFWTFAGFHLKMAVLIKTYKILFWLFKARGPCLRIFALKLREKLTVVYHISFTNNLHN